MSLLPSGAIETGDYNINNSLRFRSSASAYLNRTPASAGNRQIMTYSFWVKRGALTADYNLTNATTDASNSATLYFNSSNNQTFDVFLKVGGTNYSLTTSQVFRDPSAWYHIVVAIDTTQATSSNRTKVYVNGSQVTNFLTANYVPQNSNLALNNNVAQYIGYSSYFDGYMTEINFIDGQALTPSLFGQTDAVTGSWVAKKYTGTYGTNGFYLPFTNYSTSGGVFSSYYGNFNSTGTTSTSTLLRINDNAVFNSGSSDFCWELFFYPTTSTSGSLIGKGGSVIYESIAISYDGSTGITVYISNPSNVYIVGGTYSSSTLALNKWNHVAVYRSGSSWYIAINGNVQLMATSSNSVIDNSGPFIIGGNSNATSAVGVPITGRMSNLRYVVGSSVYGASNFTPPTSALTAISGTQLLTLQNSSIVDNSANALTITQVNASYPVTTTSSSSIGYLAYYASDSSGNANNWLLNNMNVATSTDTTYDSMKDVPTLTSATVANYAVLNPLNTYASTITNGNLNLVLTDGATSRTTFATMGVSSGKYYWEMTVTATAATYYPGIGVNTNTAALPTNQSGGDATGYMYMINGQKFNNGSLTAYGSSYATNDVIGVALDMDSGTITFYKNNVSQGQAFSGISGTAVPCFIGEVNAACAVNFGQRPFAYTPPTGYKALNTYNLPDSTIKKGNSYMDATLYTQNGLSTNVVTNAGGFKPDLVWIKCRTTAGTWNNLVDSVRGVSKTVYSNSTSAEGTDNYLSSFNSNGFTLNIGDSGTNNTAGRTQVAWNWQAGQGTTSSNTSGSITSTVSVNTTAGFSIVTYTGNLTAAGNATVGHGLGVAPKMVITKRRSGTSQWMVWHTGLTNATYALQLQSTDAQVNTAGAGWLGGTVSDPTSTTFGTNYLDGRNINGQNFVAYCWAEIAGFSKFGSYTGNGSADGPFIYTGFRPKWIMIKRSDASDNWYIFDSARSGYNYANDSLSPNLSDAEYSGATYQFIDLLSNGFKLRDTYAGRNASGGTYIFMAFAECPTKHALAR